MGRRLGPAIIITFGIFLVVTSLAYQQFTKAIEMPQAVTLPETIAGFALSEESYGPQAVAEVTRLHGKKFPLSSGAYGMYGDHSSMAMCWVAGVSVSPMAARMVIEMEQAIAKGGSPFTPSGQRQVNGRTLYELSGMGQRHYYFQSDSLVIWLAADESIAEPALADTLNFYP